MGACHFATEFSSDRKPASTTNSRSAATLYAWPSGRDPGLLRAYFIDEHERNPGRPVEADVARGASIRPSATMRSPPNHATHGALGARSSRGKRSPAPADFGIAWTGFHAHASKTDFERARWPRAREFGKYRSQPRNGRPVRTLSGDEPDESQTNRAGWLEALDDLKAQLEEMLSPGRELQPVRVPKLVPRVRTR